MKEGEQLRRTLGRVACAALWQWSPSVGWGGLVEDRVMSSCSATLSQRSCETFSEVRVSGV